MNITHDTKNSLLHRREIKGLYASASNPGYVAVQKILAESAGVSDNVIVVKRITNAYGSSDFLIEAFVYDSPESLQKFEPKPKAAKGGTS